MSTSAKQIQSYKGPALLSYGFRPLFLFSAGWSAIAMAAWIAMLSGSLTLPTAFNMVDWHVHELLYGYLPAVIAGFLLTAVPNWTGRLPVTGMRLCILVLVWLIGRAAMLFSGQIGFVTAALVDLSFLVLLCFLIGREVICGRNWRNLKVVVLMFLLLCGNALFHAEAIEGAAFRGYGARLGIAVAVFLIMLIGGRIVPSFTRNWLARRKPGRLPVPFNRFDLVSMTIAGVALMSWIAMPYRTETAFLCILAGVVHIWRLGRWAGDRTFAEPLVFIMHIGYGFVPLGFFGVAFAMMHPVAVPPSVAHHAWTAGAIGVMTIAVMTRASLGHVGKPLHATQGTVFIYFCVVAAAVLRIASGLHLGLGSLALLYCAVASWIAAFVGFAVLYGPLLLRPKQ